MEKTWEVKDLCKTYITNKRQNNVLKNISFTVGKGEMVAAMGPSGSGKSTLLYTVSGMDRATSGEIFFGGRNIASMPEKELAGLRLDEMGFIFQQMYMLKNLSVLDNSDSFQKQPLQPKGEGKNRPGSYAPSGHYRGCRQ